MATVHLLGPKHGWVLDGDGPVDLRARLGAWLRRAREARGLTVAAVAAETKIPQRHLEALERGDAMGLPVFYQRAELRTVAHAVGLDEQLALDQLQAALTSDTTQQPPSTVLPPQPSVPARTVPLLAAVIAGALTVALLSWGILDGSATSQAADASNDPPAATPWALDAPASVSPVPGAAVPAAVATPVVASLTTPAVTGELPPAVAAVPTELVITTQPEGARITVNGVGWGPSPIVIRHLPPGDKRVRATMEGYAASERSITIDEGQRQAVRLQLVEAGT